MLSTCSSIVDATMGKADANKEQDSKGFNILSRIGNIDYQAQVAFLRHFQPIASTSDLRYSNMGDARVLWQLSLILSPCKSLTPSYHTRARERM